MKGKFRSMQNRFSLGVIVGIIITLVIAGSSVALADVFNSWRTTNGVVIAKATDSFLQEANENTQCPAIAPPSLLLQRMTDPNTPKDQIPLIIDIRTKDEYIAKRIPGAVWVCDWYNITKPENLDRIDAALAKHVADGYANKIVVYCHTGHKGGFVTAALGALGYNVHNLKFGFNLGWLGDTSKLSTLAPGVGPTASGTETAVILGE